MWEQGRFSTEDEQQDGRMAWWWRRLCRRREAKLIVESDVRLWLLEREMQRGRDSRCQGWLQVVWQAIVYPS
jgi:hypothetical protein